MAAVDPIMTMLMMMLLMIMKMMKDDDDAHAGKLVFIGAMMICMETIFTKATFRHGLEEYSNLKLIDMGGI